MSFLQIYDDMQPPIFKTSAFGKRVTAEICAQEVTQNETRTEEQQTHPQVAPGQTRHAHAEQNWGKPVEHLFVTQTDLKQVFQFAESLILRKLGN